MRTLRSSSDAFRRLLAALVLVPLALSGLELHTEHGFGAVPGEGEHTFVHDCDPATPLHLEATKAEEHHGCPACLARYRSSGARSQSRVVAALLVAGDRHALPTLRGLESAPRTPAAPRGPPLA